MIYHLNDPPAQVAASFYVFGLGLVLALLAAILRPLHRVWPLERTCWFFGTVLYWIAATAVGSQTRHADPSVGDFGVMIWCVALLAFFLGLFQRPSLDPRVHCTKLADFALSIACTVFFLAQLLPYGLHPPQATHWTQCRFNLVHIMRAHHDYYDTQQHFVAAREVDPPHSWRVALLPWLDQKPLFDRYQFSGTWDSTENLPAARTPMTIYQCPSRRWYAGAESLQDDQQRYFSHYARVTGSHASGGRISVQEITDGTANTVMVVEACGVNRVWTDPVDVDIDSQPIGINLPSPTRFHSPGWISSHHSGGAHMAMVDGSVRFVSEKVDAKLLKTIVTIDGDEPVGDF